MDEKLLKGETPEPAAAPVYEERSASGAEPEKTLEEGSGAEPESSVEALSGAEPESSERAVPGAEPESSAEAVSGAEPENAEESTSAAGPKMNRQPEPAAEAGYAAQPEPAAEAGYAAQPEPAAEEEYIPEPEPFHYEGPAYLPEIRKHTFRDGFVTGICFMLILSLLVSAGAYALGAGKIDLSAIRSAIGSKNEETQGEETGKSQASEDKTEKEQSDILSGTESEFSSELAKKLAEMNQIIDKQYIFKVDENKIMDSTLKGYVEGLDDIYSVYYTAKEYEDTMNSSQGNYVGIGVVVQVDPDTKAVKALSIYPGSPAEAAGMQKDDIIAKVDGTDVTSEELNNVVNMIRGTEGTKVVVTVYRNGEYIDLEMTRKSLDKITVDSRIVEDGIGYIQLTEFDQVSVDQIKTAVDDLRSQGAKKFILDLRDNPGGLLTSVVSIADMFLPKANIFYVEDKQGKRTTYDSQSAQYITEPVVVLINGNSASASEVLSGTLKDNKRATLIGTQSFGKGIVQTFFKLSDGSGLKITTAHYFTPLGTDIHGVGITPDQVVEQDRTTKADEQLEAAIKAIRKQN